MPSGWCSLGVGGEEDDDEAKALPKTVGSWDLRAGLAVESEASLVVAERRASAAAMVWMWAFKRGGTACSPELLKACNLSIVED